jgi:hypothetical protein
MMPTQRIAIVVPMAVGLIAVICTIMIHALPLGATVNFVRRERRLGRAGTGFWIDIGIVARAILYALAAHLLEIVVGGCVSNPRRIPRFWNRLLPLGRQLHVLRLR